MTDMRENAPDTVERLRKRMLSDDVLGINRSSYAVKKDDARAILDHIAALTAERDAAVAEVAQIVAWLRNAAEGLRKLCWKDDQRMAHKADAYELVADMIAAGTHKETTDGL